MYAYFDSDELIAVSGLKEPVSFFGHLANLLPTDTSTTIGLGCYGPEPSVGAWLRALPSISVPLRYNFQRECAIWSENSFAGAFYFEATPVRLRELARLAELISSPENLCDHLIGFTRKSSLVSFHDAFKGSDMLVSKSISKDQMDAFCVATGGEWKMVKNSQWRRV